jgi:exodeoxyribonuclease VII small subunit
MAKKKTSTLSYEKAMEELQEIISDLQAETVSIDQLSDRVKRAAELIDFCKNKLRTTEEDVNRLLE